MNRPEPRGGPAAGDGQVPRVLVLRALGIGDLATAVPALRALRAELPEAELTLAAPGWLAPLVDLVGAVDRLLPQPGLQVPLRGSIGAARPGPPGPDLAVNLHGRGPQSHRLLAATDPARLLGYANSAADFWVGPAWHDDDHEVRRWCRLLSWYGITTDPGDLALRVPAVPPPLPGASIVHPGAKSPERRWPVDRFGQVARYLSGAGHTVAVTGSTAERGLADEVVAAAGLPAGRNLAGRLPLAGLAALVAAARLVVCGDTGMAHLATAYGVPSVVLFGPTPPTRWGPPVGRPAHRAIWHPGRPPRDALAAVRVPEVLAAVDQVLAAG